MSSPFLTEPVAMGIPFIAHKDTRVLQIQLLSIPILQIAPELSRP